MLYKDGIWSLYWQICPLKNGPSDSLIAQRQHPPPLATIGVPSVNQYNVLTASNIRTP
jgi:hypothetical protein